MSAFLGHLPGILRALIQSPLLKKEGNMKTETETEKREKWKQRFKGTEVGNHIILSVLHKKYTIGAS